MQAWYNVVLVNGEEVIHAEDPVLIMVRDALFERYYSKDFHVVDFLYGIFQKDKEKQVN